MSEANCPKCGAEFSMTINEQDSDSQYWKCHSYERTFHDETVYFNQSQLCEIRVLTSQLAAEKQRADEAEAKREELLAMIAVESGHIQTHWASPYEKVGMENMIEKLRAENAAAESARDEAVATLTAILGEVLRAKETYDDPRWMAINASDVRSMLWGFAALLQPQEVSDGK